MAAIVFPLMIGLATGNVRPASLITAGAFSVGFGSFQQWGIPPIRTMLLAAMGMCIFSWAGTWAGSSTLTAICLSAVAGLVYAAISRHSQPASWAALQSAIWLVISTAYPAHGLQALTRGTLVLGGGLLQTAIMLLWRRMDRKSEAGSRQERSIFSEAAHPAEPVPRAFVPRLTITLVVAVVIDRWLSTQNNYWIPMTVLIVLRPGHSQTIERVIARTLGTFAGAVLAGLIVMFFPHSPWALGAGIVAFTWAAYALFYANYAYFAACLTAYVVFLLSLAGVSPHPLILHRIAFTAIGGGLTLVAWLIKRNAP